MPTVLLSKFLRFLEWVEKAQIFFQFLTQPIGLSAFVAALVYWPILSMGCDQLAAATLSSSVAMTLYCWLEQPDI